MIYKMIDTTLWKEGMGNKIKLAFISIYLAVLMLSASLNGQESTDFLQRALHHPDFKWIRLSNENINMYYTEGSFAEKHRVMLLGSLESSIMDASDMLETDGCPDSVNVFYVESREQMEEVIGMPYAGFTNWSTSSMFLVLNSDWRSFERHEFAHLVTMKCWGRPHPSSGWMVEGIPVYCDGWCGEYSVNQVAYYLMKENTLPTLDNLFINYRDMGEIPAGFSSASLAGFIAEEFGAVKLRRLWEEGSDKIEEILEIDLRLIEKGWRDYIKSDAGGKPAVDYQEIIRNGCG